MANVSKYPLLMLVVFVILFGSASVLKSFGIFANQVRATEVMIGGDIYLHFIASFFLGQLCWLTTQRTSHFRLSIPTLTVLVLVVLDESLQYLIPSRQFSWLDMTVNVFGVLLGTSFCSAIATLRSKTKAIH
ncbi:VanZ like family protein [Grimontia celer]|uniref:VanZ like family protein n=2 Tax=Grimontia celer TaxID=1796497 RepID=A0A128EZQ8_9GAMM|nr:VanZ like family protein [Grimontia celer]